MPQVSQKTGWGVELLLDSRFLVLTDKIVAFLRRAQWRIRNTC